MDKIKVLFFAANPKRDLNLEEEIHKIEGKLRASEQRSLELVPALATRRSDLIDKLNWHKPHIVHFSGHGSKAGQIYFVGDDGTAKPVGQDALVALFRACKDNIRLAVFNACYSHPLAEALIQGQVVDFAIGMDAAIGDEAARTFAARFYGSLSDGRSVRQAFDQARVELMLEEIPEEQTPELLARDGVNASQVFLLNFRHEDTASHRNTPTSAEPVDRIAHA